MSERMRPLDMRFLTQESASTPMHVATLDIFEPPADAFDYQRLVALIHDRLAFLPRYRQRVKVLPGRLLNPVWVDDADFDLGYHVRRSSLPRPGSLEQLRELVARIMSRRLDRNRPLWETYVVEGLDGDRFAILTKSHQVLVDGTTVDLGQLILDDSPVVPPTPDVRWDAERSPNGVELLVDSLTESLRHPAVAADNLRGQLVTAGQLATRARELVGAVVPRQVVSLSGPLETVLSEQRRFATVETRLSAYRTIRAAHGGSVNDVVLATITGALRAWLLTRGDSAASSMRIRALVPMSVVDDEFAQPTSLGSQVTPHLLTLPLSETSPIMRLHQVSYAFKTHQETGRAVGATRLTKIAGFAPTTFHMVGSRVAATAPGRAFDLVLTNVPGPQFPLYAAGARMLASYPVPPLLAGHALAIGVTSYDGRVFYGLDADRDALPDLEVLGSCITEALDELLEAS
nr:wax ester/triacylglycerol synthase family O-acyltransferase [Nocardioidaceae bacterium]